MPSGARPGPVGPLPTMGPSTMPTTLVTRLVTIVSGFAGAAAGVGVGSTAIDRAAAMTGSTVAGRTVDDSSDTVADSLATAAVAAAGAGTSFSAACCRGLRIRRPQRRVGGFFGWVVLSSVAEREVFLFFVVGFGLGLGRPDRTSSGFVGAGRLGRRRGVRRPRVGLGAHHPGPDGLGGRLATASVWRPVRGFVAVLVGSVVTPSA